jgi:SAM-dependent methyltransferase
MADAAKLVRDHWSGMAKNPLRRFSWTDASSVRDWVRGAVSGDPNVGWSEYAARKYLMAGGRGVAEGAVLGCGAGQLERDLRRLGAVEHIDAYDIAPGAVEEAARLAAAAGVGGISYHVADLNWAELPAGKYDVAFCPSSAHHVERLEHLYAQVLRALKPGGHFILMEYVGPAQLQAPPKVVRIVNDLLRVLPPELRVQGYDGIVKSSFEPPTREFLTAADPSEAIRSDELLPLLGRYFEVVDVKPYGGPVNHVLLQAIVHNFDESRPEGRGLLTLLMYLEALLMDEGVLAPAFAFIVARSPRPAAGVGRGGFRLLRWPRRVARLLGLR